MNILNLIVTIIAKQNEVVISSSSSIIILQYLAHRFNFRMIRLAVAVVAAVMFMYLSL